MMKVAVSLVPVLLFSSYVLAQTTIQVEIPTGSSTAWSVNGNSYTGATTSINVSGGTNNTASFQDLPASGLYQIGIASNPVSSNESLPPVYNPTNLQVNLSNGEAVSTGNSIYQVQATGGNASYTNVGYGTGFWANTGSSLSVNSAGVGASVQLGVGSSGSAYLLNSTGGSGFGIYGNYTNYASAASGGSVSGTFASGPSQGALLPTTVLVYGVSPTPAPQPYVQMLPWLIQSSAIQATSLGGTSSAWVLDQGKDQIPIAGMGGNGANVNLTIGSVQNSRYLIQLGTSTNTLAATSSSPVAGVLATSIGTPGAVCCASSRYGTSVVWGPVTLNTSPADYVLGPGPLFYGQNGSGGAVNVQLTNSSITGSSGNLYGVIASSVGASTQIPTGFTGGQPNAPSSGVGGPVSVTQSNSSIQLSGQDSFGIFASSTSNQTIVPSSIAITGSNTAGAVSVTLDALSAVTVGSASTISSGQLSAGVLGVSSTGWQFQPVGLPVNGTATAGNGGAVSINNAGAISASGNLAIGLAALSLGNGGILSNAQQTVSGINYVTTANTGAVSANTSGLVTVNNTNSVSVAGATSFGIMAASNGSGGLLMGIPDAQFGSVSTNYQNIKIGTLPSGYAAGAGSSNFVAPGGNISLTNTGAITTSGGNASVGVLAQSVGGGGASYTYGTALFVGDSGGSGGGGGSINLTNSGAITTAGDGSLGFLIQSVGGGGGHAANAAGLFTAVGGRGGTGGAGGEITASFQSGSAITTTGDYSTGMVAQSIGGGGGNGGFSKGYGVFFSTANGGAGGSGGQGGNIVFSGASNSSFITSGDQSHGALLQSIGGGGGTSGAASSYSAGIAFGTSVAVGGVGGGGGSGGSIGTSSSPISNSGQFTTAGNDSHGILMQSIGGGGGNGGGAMAKTLGLSFPLNPEIPTLTFSSAVGGSGGAGGSGGGIFFNNAGSITTSGSNSFALLAQSIGGGGGNGGDSTAGANLYGNSTYTLNSSISLGGSGGVAGNGGQISLANTGLIQTFGNNSISFLGQSIGGGGGTGGSANATETKATTGEKSLNLVLSLGGSGGAAGSGGAITLSNNNLIQNLGSSSSGVIAQSIGGGGGIGANAGTQGISNGLTAVVAIGASGGAGGDAGEVSITNTGNINTGGLFSNASNNPLAIGGDSHGIVAQSIAGGGGIGGSSDPAANLISNPYALTTQGLQTYATYNGIYEFIESPSLATFPKDYQATVGVGGNGGGAGNANAVTVNNSGSINTIGHRAFGVLAQSIGGGGGSGTAVMSGSSAVGSSASGGLGLGAFAGLTFNSAVNVGGVGGASSNGNNIFISQSGTITTAGYGSYAVLAQSIGGGGGYGADGSIAANTGFTGTATWNDGVSGGFRIGLGATGANPSIGDGGAVTYTGSSSSTITTYGDNAVGILAQSIGGGGGVGSGGCTNNGLTSGASACLASTVNAGNAATPANFINQGQMMALVINPSTNVSNDPNLGGGVDINSQDTINIYGSGSIGVAAQSIGGGGGLILANSVNIASATLPAMGTSVGMGGTVSVNVNNINLQSSATGSIGVLAQSIGGGGGFLGDPNMPLSASLPSNSGTLITGASNATGGGSVGVVVNGNIAMYGANQIGVVAQSVGGGGGFSSVNGNVVTQNVSAPQGSQAGAGGYVGIVVNGAITDLGNQGGTIGIFAQSQGNSELSSASSINIDVNTTTINGVSTSGSIKASTGIVVSGGSIGANGNPPNQISVDSGASIIVPNGNNAIVATNGVTDVYNYGTISGGILVGPTPGYNSTGGSVFNYGTINATGTITTSNNSFNNYGSLYVAGSGLVGQTNMYGSYKQFASGKAYFDVNTVLNTSDHLEIVANGSSAGTMFQNGSFIMNRIYANLLPSKGSHFNLVTAQGGYLPSANGISAVPVQIFDNSPVVDWRLNQIGHNLTAVYQGLNKNPSGVSLNNNQQNLLNYLVSAYDNNDTGVNAAIERLVSNSTGSPNLAGILDGLNGTAQTIQQQTIVMTANGMLGNALSCPTIAQSNTYSESECVWGKFNGGQMRQAYSDVNPGFRVNENTFSLGFQQKTSNDIFIGASVRYGQTNSSSTNFGANASVGDVSIGLKKIVDDYYLGISGAFGVSSQSNNRYAYDSYLGQSYNLTSHSNVYYGGIRIRNAYQFNLPLNSYVRPYLDLDGLWMYTPSYQESGALQSVPLQYNAQNGSNFIASPMIEFGGRLNLVGTKDMWLRPFVSAGAMFITNNSSNISAAIIGANSGTFNIATQSPSSLFKANAGIQVFSGEKLDIKLEYSGLAGGGFVGQSGTAKAAFSF